MRVSKKHKSQLEAIKDTVGESYQYFEPNFRRYHEFKKFVYKTTLTEDELTVLESLDKPQIEFNIMEAYISRLRGEFSKMQPGFVVRAQDTVDYIDPRLIKVLEGHFRAMLSDADNDGFSYDVYTDLLVGGFSVAEVYTDYISEMSMDQKIFVERVFDPTLCGFDPLARKSHKGDGQYAFQLFPKTVEEAVDIYGSDIKKGLKYARNVRGFNWSYRSGKNDIILICDYYKKEYKKKKITKLTNGRVVTVDDYEMLLARWDEIGGFTQAPQPVGKIRTTELETIKRFRFSGAKMIDVVDTNYSMLPLVFFDGNSVVLRDNEDSPAQQMTRPYVYNLKDTQRLKNFAGQSLANELENTVEHKFIASIESVPEDYLDAYVNVQKPSTLLYNQFMDGDPSVPLNAPREVVRTPIPPEISATFQMTDNLMQSILGTYDAALGINNKELSGVAIMQGAMHSNSASMPCTVGFIKGLNRVAKIALDLIPKYYVTPRSLPVVHTDGKRTYEIINKPNSVNINFDAKGLGVKVEAGVNFEVQKQISLETMIQLMQTSETFKAFINKKGIPILLDNIDIRGIDALKEQVGEFMQEMEQQEQAAMEMQQKQAQQQLDPNQIMAAQVEVENRKVEQKSREAELKAQVDLTKIAADDAVKNKQADIDFIEAMAKIDNQNIETALKQEQIDAENTRSAVDMAMKVAGHQQKNTDTIKVEDEEM